MQNRFVLFSFLSFFFQKGKSRLHVFWILKSAESSLQPSFLTAHSEITPIKCHYSSFKKSLIQTTSLFFWSCHRVDWNRYILTRQSLNGGTSVTMMKCTIEWCWKRVVGVEGGLSLKPEWVNTAAPSYHILSYKGWWSKHLCKRFNEWNRYYPWNKCTKI